MHYSVRKQLYRHKHRMEKHVKARVVGNPSVFISSPELCGNALRQLNA